MNKIQHLGYLAAFGILAACTSPSASDASDGSSSAAKESPDNGYQKPGAAITFTVVSGDETAVSAKGTLKVSVAEQYDTGTINIAVTGSEGLYVFATSSDVTLEAAGASTHDLNIDYRADTDGKFYVNLTATAPDGRLRAHAIAVTVGEPQEAARKPSDDIQVDSNGDPVIVMEAEETTE